MVWDYILESGVWDFVKSDRIRKIEMYHQILELYKICSCPIYCISKNTIDKNIKNERWLKIFAQYYMLVI